MRQFVQSRTWHRRTYSPPFEHACSQFQSLEYLDQGLHGDFPRTFLQRYLDAYLKAFNELRQALEQFLEVVEDVDDTVGSLEIIISPETGEQQNVLSSFCVFV